MGPEPADSSYCDIGQVTGSRAPVLRTVIVDDEQPAREHLKLLLADEPGINVVAECTNGAAALAALNVLSPDLLLMDIQLPDIDGLFLLKGIPTDKLPFVILTTDHDQCAINEFETDSVDCLSKPFDRRRLKEALNRARMAVTTHNIRLITDQLLQMLRTTRTAPLPDRFLIRVAGRLYFLECDAIEWLEAVGNYVRVHAGPAAYMIRGSIGTVAHKLPETQFVRIHRSAIVNISMITELQRCNRTEFMVVLRSGKQLACSRSYRSGLQRIIDSTTAL